MIHKKFLKISLGVIWALRILKISENQLMLIFLYFIHCVKILILLKGSNFLEKIEMERFVICDYREYLKSRVDQAKLIQSTKSYSYFANKIKVQKAYLSQFFKQNVHLNNDQIFLLAKELKLTKVEMDYLDYLVEYSKSSLEIRKAEIEKRIFNLNHLFTPNIVNKKEKFFTAIDSSAQIDWKTYFSEPYCVVFHVHMQIPKFLRKPKLIGKHLGLSIEKTDSVLNKLVESGVVENKGGIFKVLHENLTMPNDFEIIKKFAIDFRVLSNSYLQKSSESSKDTFFSATFPIDESTRDKVLKQFHRFMTDSYGEFMKDSEVDGAYQINFDFFKY